jgi:hypothetical protein
MLYGDEKVKTISRSVLPASRRMARNAKGRKRAWNQTTRRRMDREIDDFFVPGATAEEIEDAYLDSGSTHVDTYNPSERHTMTRIRNKRRLADNLGPVTRWTAALIKETGDAEAALEIVERELPSDLAGRHAMDHMRTEFSDEARYYTPPWRVYDREKILRTQAMNYALWEHVLTVLFEHNHKGMNRAIKENRITWFACAPTCTEPSWGDQVRTTHIHATDERAAFVTCHRCGRSMRNTVVPTISTAEDIELFITRVGPKISSYRVYDTMAPRLLDALRKLYERIEAAA